MNNLLEISGLSVEITSREKTIPVLRGIDLSLGRGQVLGLVGESGCGKTITVLAVLGLLPRGGAVSGGSIRFMRKDLTRLSGREMAKLRGKHISMIFQEPMTSLNPLMSVGEQLGEVLYCHEKISGKANREKCIDLLNAVQIPNPDKILRCRPFRLSGGMRQRVMTALALACEPELVIADEPTTALDVTTQSQIIDLFNVIRKRSRSSFIFVSHDLGILGEIADRIGVIYAGLTVEECAADVLLNAPWHPYTSGLMRARIGRRYSNREPLYTIPGTVPSPGNPGPGCPFYSRCEKSLERCVKAMPPFSEIEEGHRVRCWRFAE
jgi:oligopeptide/dipeptide ABC transporter ATP-binding protein